MKIKTLLSLFACGLAASFCRAQTIDTAQMEGIYYCEYIGNRLQPERKYKEYLSLQIGERYTHFSSESRRLIDSIRDANPGDYKSQLATSDGKIITPRPGETEADLKAQSADKEFVFTLTSLNRASNSPIQKDEIQAYRIYPKKEVLRMKKQGLRNPYRDIEANDIEVINE